MIEKLYSDFDADITIRAKVGKTFNEKRIDSDSFVSLPGVIDFSRAIEETVVLKHQDKWVNANLIGVDSSFLRMSQMKRHMVDGTPRLNIKGEDFALIGASLLDKLDGFIPQNVGHESIICYAPKRDIKMSFGKSPFTTGILKLSGRFNFNREVNAQFIIVPIHVSKELLNYSKEVSALYVDVDNDFDLEDIKSKIQNIVGDEFNVKTNYEKNELIYKTSKSEKLIVLIILLFIFVLAAFNLVASLTMLFVEKLENIKTMIAFGGNKQFIFKIFFFEGLLIAGKGVLFGVIIGYLVSFLQIQFHLIVMPSSGGEAFPMSVSWSDGVLVLGLVSSLSLIFSYFPVKYLIRRNIN